MSARLHAITIDRIDHERVGRFWAETLGWADDPDNPNEPGDPEWLLVSPDGAIHLLFQQVPEHKAGKNRLHLDLEPLDRRRDAEVEHLLGRGASLLSDQRRPDGSGWVVLADPEGNEFCVVRSAAELRPAAWSAPRT